MLSLDIGEAVYTALVIAGVDTSIDGVDTGSLFLEFFHEDRVQCVDTAPGSVDTRPSSQETQLPDWDRVSTQSLPRAFWKKARRAGKRNLHPEEQSSAAKGRRRSRREAARDCSSADPEGDPAESVFGQSVKFSGESVCNKSGHMKVDCPDAKKDKYKTHKKEFHKKKNKAMVATWSDDESPDCNEESLTSDENEVYTALVIDGVDTGSLFLEFFHENRVQCVDTAPGSVDTRPSS
ncbi:hypothetical protein Taro_022202 [Colocasia esculenta]|uniref:Uncharacterized protein n=1 Tax=Colocasia esculenta TaxID=4460 RepID=A0A843V4P2_COLES|nr:hypothetical protein [Colocasia esculenta]